MLELKLPKNVSIFQFDHLTFNRNWTFNGSINTLRMEKRDLSFQRFQFATPYQKLSLGQHQSRQKKDCLVTYSESQYSHHLGCGADTHLYLGIPLHFKNKDCKMIDEIIEKVGNGNICLQAGDECRSTQFCLIRNCLFSCSFVPRGVLEKI